MNPRRRVLTPEVSPEVEVAASNSSGGAAAGAAPAPLRAPPVPEEADATPVDTAGE